MATVAVLGTGLLGAGFVENLLAKGETVRIWNRTAEKLGPLVARGAIATADPAECVRGAERVHLVLTADDAVDATLAALRPGLGEGVPVLDHSTNDPARVAARAPRCWADGVRYLHAPVFMSPQNARESTGLLLISGPAAFVEPVLPALGTLCAKAWNLGARPELAAIYKLVGNGVFVALAGTMGDLLTIGAAQGLGPSEVLALFDVFKPGGALPFIGQRVAAGGSGPASFELSMARKDVGLMIGAAGGADGLIVLPAIAAAMDAAIAAGLGARDFAAYATPKPR